MNKRVKIISLAAILIIAFVAGDTLASAVEMWFSRLPVNVEANRTAIVLPGGSLWIVVRDPGRNIDPTVPDRIEATEINVGSLNSWLWLNREWLEEMKGEGALARRVRYLRETGPDTGLFVFSEPIIIGARQLTATPVPLHTHIPAPWLPDPYPQMWITGGWTQFQLGAAERHVLNPSHPAGNHDFGRFIDGDTLIGFYQSVLNDAVSASAIVEISRSEATITWDRTVYPAITGPALITVRDADENLNPNKEEYVPVFIIVNPGTWNPVQIVGGVQTAPLLGHFGLVPAEAPARMRSATSFQMLLESGGVVLQPAPAPANTWQCRGAPIRWYNIYDLDRRIVYVTRVEGQPPGLVNNEGRPAHFKTLNEPYMPGLTTVIFLAKETGPNTGIFELRLDNIQARLGFATLGDQYVLAAFYLDANDFSDMEIATAYALSRPDTLPVIFFADAGWTERTELSLGRDRINVGVNYSPLNRDYHAREAIVVQVFTPHSTDRDWIRLDEAGVKSPHFRSPLGLELGPVIWDTGDVRPPWDPLDLGLTKYLAAFNRSAIFVRMNAVRADCYPIRPEIITHWYDHRRVAYAEIRVTRTRLEMSFVNYAGAPVPGYTIGERVFIRVSDADQNEDRALREHIPVLLMPGGGVVVVNFRTGKFVYRELWENDVNTGIFHTVNPIHLIDDLNARTGDTIHAIFVDPSDLSDARIITTRVVAIVNRPPVADDDTFDTLMDRVLTIPVPGVLEGDTDPDPGDRLTAELVTNVPLPHRLEFRTNGSFTFTPGPGFIGTVTFTYRARDDRGGISGTATVTITVRAVVVVPPPLVVRDFRVVHGLMPTFSFIGEGTADTFTVIIFNMLGREVWRIEVRDVRPEVIVRWDGKCAEGNLLAKGPYIFVAKLKDGDILFTIRGTVFRK